jgi:hypothetical protein
MDINCERPCDKGCISKCDCCNGWSEYHNGYINSDEHKAYLDKFPYFTGYYTFETEYHEIGYFERGMIGFPEYAIYKQASCINDMIYKIYATKENANFVDSEDYYDCHILVDKGITYRDTCIKTYMFAKDYFFMSDNHAETFFAMVPINPHLIVFITPEIAKKYNKSYEGLMKSILMKDIFLLPYIVPTEITSIEELIIDPMIELINKKNKNLKNLKSTRKIRFHDIPKRKSRNTDDNSFIKCLFRYPMSKKAYNKIFGLCTEYNYFYYGGLEYIDMSIIDNPSDILKTLCMHHPRVFKFIKFNSYTKDILCDYATLAKWYVANDCNSMKHINENFVSNEDYAKIAMIAAKKTHRNLYHTNLLNPAINKTAIVYAAVTSPGYKEYSYRTDDRELYSIWASLPESIPKRIILKKILRYRPFVIDTYANTLERGEYNSFLESLSKDHPYAIVYCSRGFISENKPLLFDTIKKFIIMRKKQCMAELPLLNMIKKLNTIYHIYERSSGMTLLFPIEYNMNMLEEIYTCMAMAAVEQYEIEKKEIVNDRDDDSESLYNSRIETIYYDYIHFAKSYIKDSQLTDEIKDKIMKILPEQIKND